MLAFHDVTERWAALERLVESDRRYRMIAEASRSIVTESDADGRFTFVSDACSRVLGYAPGELVGSKAVQLLHREDRDAFFEALRSELAPGHAFSVPAHRLRRRDDSWVWVEATGVTYRRADGELRLIGVARSIEARRAAEATRRELEERVRRGQKLESLGTLAGGIAHDFNNLLTPILGAAGLLLTELPEESPARKRAETIRQAATRAAALTHQMLAYAGGSGMQLETFDVSEAIREMLLLLEATVSRQAAFRCELAEDLPPLRADRAQLGQVVMNLVANASEALGAAGGCIQLRSGVLDADRELLEKCILGEKRDPGRYVSVEVRDDGPGIDPESRARIFDPFFTTKFTGRGLGLSVVLGIVREHAGALQIESEPGLGTCFRVLLPVAREVCHEPPREPQMSATQYALHPWTGYFLVVDDDDAVREFASILLERAGFSVRTAASGREAIDILRKREHGWLGVILDLTMPGLGGARACEEILKIDPATRILLISGYTRNGVADAIPESGAVDFLQKPFDADQLLEAVRRLLDAHP